MKVYIKKLFFLLMAAIMSLSLAACGGKQPSEPEEDVQYDENGNPIVEEETNTLLYSDSETMMTGLIARMDNGTITDNGVWLTESEVGAIAERYALGEYKNTKGSFSKKEVKYVASFYDINNELISSMFFDENMDMCYENKQMISDSIMRGMFAEYRDRIEKDSVIVFEQPGMGNNMSANPQQQEQPQDSNNNTLVLSRQAFIEAGISEATAQVLAQSTFNLKIPVIVSARVEANTVMFTDVDGKQYTLSVIDGKIASVYNDTDGISLY